MLCRRIESGSRSRLAIAVMTAGESNSIAVADSEIRTTAKARGAIFTAMSSSHDARRSRCLRQDLAARLEHAVAFVRLVHCFPRPGSGRPYLVLLSEASSLFIQLATCARPAS